MEPRNIAFAKGKNIVLTKSAYHFKILPQKPQIPLFRPFLPDFIEKIAKNRKKSIFILQNTLKFCKLHDNLINAVFYYHKIGENYKIKGGVHIDKALRSFSNNFAEKADYKKLKRIKAIQKSRQSQVLLNGLKKDSSYATLILLLENAQKLPRVYAESVLSSKKINCLREG